MGYMEVNKVYAGLFTFLRGRYGFFKPKTNPVARLRYAIKLDREEYIQKEQQQ